MSYLEQNTVTVELNELILYDSVFLKALSPTTEAKFLSYLSETSVFRTKLKKVEEEVIFTARLELSNIKQLHFRYT